jgi:hypothetical protein
MGHTVKVAETLAFKRRLRQRYEAVQGMERLSWDEKAGVQTLLIRGRWLRSRSRIERDQAAKTLRCLAGCQDLFSRPPQVVGKKLRISMRGERSKITRKIARFDKLRVPYRVIKLAEVDPRADSQSA